MVSGVLAQSCTEQIAMAQAGVERVVAEAAHPAELGRPKRREAEAVVEQRGPHRHGEGQVVRRHHRPEDTGIGWRQARIESGWHAALGEERRPFGQPLKQLHQLGRRRRDDVERRHHARRRPWRGHARLMAAVERMPLAGVVARRRGGDIADIGPGRRRRRLPEATGHDPARSTQAEQYAATIGWQRWGIGHDGARPHSMPRPALILPTLSASLCMACAKASRSAPVT